MAQATATIRVSRRTRDELAKLARAKGTSLSAYLDGIVQTRRRQEVFESERKAQRLDTANFDVDEETADWDETLEDGLD